MNKRKKMFMLILFIIIIVIIVITVIRSKKEKPIIREGFSYTYTPDTMMMGVESDVDTFQKDNVQLQLYYGLHRLDDAEKYGVNSKGYYKSDNMEKIYFAMYVCDVSHELAIVNGNEVPDYKNLTNHYYIREITEAEAFTKEFGYKMNRSDGIIYGHSETITIPQEVLKYENGTFVVKIISYVRIREKDWYKASRFDYITFDYAYIDENTVKIRYIGANYIKIK